MQLHMFYYLVSGKEFQVLIQKRVGTSKTGMAAAPQFHVMHPKAQSSWGGSPAQKKENCLLQGVQQNRASCLRREAEPASETWCFSVYVSFMQWTNSKRRRLYLQCYFYNSALFFTLRSVVNFHIQNEGNGLKKGEPLLLLIFHSVLEG